jgi:outer membrane protein assembly factor BamD
MRLLLVMLVALCSLTLVGCKTTTLEQQYKNKNEKQIFDRAEHSMARGKYETAAKDFEALDNLYPFGPYAQQAQLDIVYAYYRNNDAESALAAADRYIRLYPRSPDVDYVYYLKGLIDMGTPETWLDYLVRTNIADRDVSGLEQAFKDFAVLIERFPQSAYAPDARKRMVYIRNLLAAHNLRIAQYYLNRKAYVAAANRAGDIVKDYQGAPEVIPALGIMVESYRGLGETGMANDALQILVNNYPNSPEAKRLQR